MLMKRLVVSGFFIFLLCFGFAQESAKTLSGKLIIFHAGSLAVPFREIAGEFRKKYPQVEVQMESAGSVDCARKITDLKKPCDIMASSDYKVIDQMLIPGYAQWNLPFVSNEMCLVFTEKSKYAAVISQRNWVDILTRSDVVIGRSDPNADPCGYRSVMTMQLAEKFYGKPGWAKTVTDKDRNMIRPKEVDLIALLETRTVDYIFLYKSVAIQHKLKYLELPDEVNLKNPGMAELYRTAVVSIQDKQPGETKNMTGEPMVYGITILTNAPNRPAALAFVEFLMNPATGMHIMNRNGQPSLKPARNSGYAFFPESLKNYVLPQIDQ
jgi:molybdate/tungstate transport system substrate-binding protein